MEQLPSTKQVFNIGQSIQIENNGSLIEHKIINILDSQRVSNVIGLKYNIQNPVDVLIIDGQEGTRQAAYHKDLKVILAFDKTPANIMHHEIIHSLELTKTLNPDLVDFYEKVKGILPDKLNINPNWRKDIHEFVADGYSKEGFIESLRDIEVYDEFLKLTEYIFQ